VWLYFRRAWFKIFTTLNEINIDLDRSSKIIYKLIKVNEDDAP
jgi:hypothetical protein